MITLSNQATGKKMLGNKAAQENEPCCSFHFVAETSHVSLGFLQAISQPTHGGAEREELQFGTSCDLDSVAITTDIHLHLNVL